MAYEKQTWECGETITAEKLNHIEDGIADASSGGVLVVGIDHDIVNEGIVVGAVYDKTWKEVNDALVNGLYVVVVNGLWASLSDGENRQDPIFKTAYNKRSGWTANVHRFGNYDSPIVTLYACSEDGYLQDAQCE